MKPLKVGTILKVKESHYYRGEESEYFCFYNILKRRKIKNE